VIWDRKWSGEDLLVLSGLVLALAGMGFLLTWAHLQPRTAFQTPLTAYVNRAEPGTYWVQDGRVQVAYYASGEQSGFLVEGNNLEIILTPENKTAAEKVVTNLAGKHAWPWISYQLESELQSGQPDIFGGVQITVGLNKTAGAWEILVQR
jgi:hypothetical protein